MRQHEAIPGTGRVSRRRMVAAVGGSIAAIPISAYAAPAVREFPASTTATFVASGVVGGETGGSPSQQGPNTGSLGGAAVGGVREEGAVAPAVVANGEVVVSLPATGIGETSR